ncbi:MAG: hypothetical protein UW46_C0003G0027 [Candidatus Yanofskybacteria bacterium GW2011_GWF1_44_227]|uniref:Uncharacterized protein n=1 Tax=Candidatus Yanofskybacteria bacterium GW2011_GWE2_40_11 TaxID=1619033 RepID=A0A0G0QLB9_9BACT|nr:MAG: hypothetical protein UT69_C0008G0030 [Candidatus Yanofskybacteria bacterium GW2011_GWE1_40_10]KKR41219.1 MAG: hypothetical protein UT75_C0001G0123 [Candidatus Yanofskybacteria bacterium GW2011_GWE2_40_11]KKT15706.1 MAG: hypothetical protein UV97_C0003G0038 [Candidatus Yanofskybacteria bacterium GW2011_GWF2_43_596]KKT53406.1 MAG: hypothetical protein UW46_C0003G0027 [Candidatus Yanofskybacteria bacterium GW2011_GWF1_44_227]OGN36182.1 MAG: hypothetical protein A2241_00340 [Candidatus Yano
MDPEKKDWWGVTIRKASNGFVIIDNEGNESVVQEEDDDELIAGEKLLWEIIEFFGLQGDRYSKDRVAIIRKIGDKYTPSPEDKIEEITYQRIIK